MNLNQNMQIEYCSLGKLGELKLLIIIILPFDTSYHLNNITLIDIDLLFY